MSQANHESIDTSHLRIDAAHALTHAQSDSGAYELEAAGVRQLESLEQLDLHASQLATRLQSKQSELNRREIQLNAQAARLENELRQLRLTSQEQSVSISDVRGRAAKATPRPTAIDKSIEEGLAELQRRETRLLKREADADQREQDLLAREAKIKLRARQLAQIKIEQHDAAQLDELAKRWPSEDG